MEGGAGSEGEVEGGGGRGAGSEGEVEGRERWREVEG